MFFFFFLWLHLSTQWPFFSFLFFLIHCQFTDTVAVFSSEFHGSSCLASQNTYLTAYSPPDLSLKKASPSVLHSAGLCERLQRCTRHRRAVLRAREIVLLPTSLGLRSVCTALPAPPTFLLPFNYRASPCRKPSWKSQLVPAMTLCVCDLIKRHRRDFSNTSRTAPICLFTLGVTSRPLKVKWCRPRPLCRTDWRGIWQLLTPLILNSFTLNFLSFLFDQPSRLSPVEYLANLMYFNILPGKSSVRLTQLMSCSSPLPGIKIFCLLLDKVRPTFFIFIHSHLQVFPAPPHI